DEEAMTSSASVKVDGEARTSSVSVKVDEEARTSSASVKVDEEARISSASVKVNEEPRTSSASVMVKKPRWEFPVLQPSGGTFLKHLNLSTYDRKDRRFLEVRRKLMIR
ncbi:hypothetical protein OTU49_011356, partial [Cherax quadricarinatus]